MIAFSRRSTFPALDDAEGLVAGVGLAARAEHLHDLTVTNPTRAGLGVGGDFAEAYEPDPLGALEARRAVVGYYAARGHALDAESMVLSASTSEAYAWLFKLLADPGDAVLVPTPSYPLFDCLAELESVRALRYRLDRDEHFRVDAGEVERALDREPAVRAIVVVAPNNPTGTCVLEEDARALEALAARRGLPLVVDEVFAETVDPASSRRPLRASWASSDVALTFVLSGLSKVACAPGAKLAWTLVRGPEAARREALRRLAIIADTYLSVSARVQRELAARLAGAGDVQRALGARLAENRAVAARVAEGTAGLVTALPSHGGWSLVIEVPRVMSDDAWSARLLAAGVRVQSGSLFDLAGGRSLVVSLLGEPADFRAGMEVLAEVVVAECAGR